MPCRMLSPLLNERHLVDFFEGCYAIANFRQCGVSQERHALIARGTLDLGRRAAADNHLADTVGQVKQLGNCTAAPESGSGTLDTSRPLDELHLTPLDRIET